MAKRMTKYEAWSVGLAVAAIALAIPSAYYTHRNTGTADEALRIANATSRPYLRVHSVVLAEKPVAGRPLVLELQVKNLGQSGAEDIDFLLHSSRRLPEGSEARGRAGRMTFPPGDTQRITAHTVDNWDGGLGLTVNGRIRYRGYAADTFWEDMICYFAVHGDGDDPTKVPLTECYQSVIKPNSGK